MKTTLSATLQTGLGTRRCNTRMTSILKPRVSSDNRESSGEKASQHEQLWANTGVVSGVVFPAVAACIP